MESFITIATFNYPHEVFILKHLLNREGLAYFFENEAMLSIVPMYSIALGGIRLKVHPNDAEVVNAILSTLNDGTILRIV